MNALQALAVALPPIYAAAAVGFATGRSTWATWALRAALILHVVDFALRASRLGHFPVIDLWTTVSACAFATAALWAIVARNAAHTGSGGLVLGLVAALQIAASSGVPLAPQAKPAGMSALAVTHVATSCVALAALFLSGLHGVLWLALFRSMRARRFSAFFERLPNLDTLAKMTRRAALLGFLGLTVGLNVGIGLAHAENSAGFEYIHPEVLLSLVLWLHFGVIAFSQKIPGLGARRASFAAAGGLVAALASVVLLLFPHHFHGAM